MPFGMPTFPLNTDGIDLWSRDFVLERIKITNFDDAIVPKPSTQSFNVSKCTQNITVRDIETKFSIGMTVGSVPPVEDHNCVRDVSFSNVVMHEPIKGIYLKSNPGDKGDGLIKGISYTNFVMHNPLFWGIWIGPQQQAQPGGFNAGCSWLYPFIGDCPTNPLVTFEDISLKNITSTGNLLTAGVIICNETNPCKNFTFVDVHISSPLFDKLGKDLYTVANIEGVAINSSPIPNFKPPGFELSD